MQEEMEKRQQDLADAQDMIRRLEEQLKLLQAAKEELEARQNELQVHNMKDWNKWTKAIQLPFLKLRIMV